MSDFEFLHNHNVSIITIMTCYNINATIELAGLKNSQDINILYDSYKLSDSIILRINHDNITYNIRVYYDGRLIFFNIKLNSIILALIYKIISYLGVKRTISSNNIKILDIKCSIKSNHTIIPEQLIPYRFIKSINHDDSYTKSLNGLYIKTPTVSYRFYRKNSGQAIFFPQEIILQAKSLPNIIRMYSHIYSHTTLPHVLKFLNIKETSLFHSLPYDILNHLICLIQKL